MINNKTIFHKYSQNVKKTTSHVIKYVLSDKATVPDYATHNLRRMFWKNKYEKISSTFPDVI